MDLPRAVRNRTLHRPPLPSWTRLAHPASRPRTASAHALPSPAPRCGGLAESGSPVRPARLRPGGASAAPAWHRGLRPRSNLGSRSMVLGAPPSTAVGRRVLGHLIGRGKIPIPLPGKRPRPAGVHAESRTRQARAGAGVASRSRSGRPPVASLRGASSRPHAPLRPAPSPSLGPVKPKARGGGGPRPPDVCSSWGILEPYEAYGGYSGNTRV